MRMRDFLRENRAEIDDHIRARLQRPEFKLNDSDRRDWLANDEGLYNWARREGVRV